MNRSIAIWLHVAVQQSASKHHVPTPARRFAYSPEIPPCWKLAIVSCKNLWRKHGISIERFCALAGGFDHEGGESLFPLWVANVINGGKHK